MSAKELLKAKVLADILGGMPDKDRHLMLQFLKDEQRGESRLDSIDQKIDGITERLSRHNSATEFARDLLANITAYGLIQVVTRLFK